MKSIGFLKARQNQIVFNQQDFKSIIHDIRSPVHLVYEPNARVLGLAVSGEISSNNNGGLPLIASFPAIYPEWLGDRSFTEAHKLRFAYVGGAMARGITSSQMVIALAKTGMLGFLGTGGMGIEQIEKELQFLSTTLTPLNLSWGANLLHTPHDLQREHTIIELYLKYGVKRVSAAAFLSITPAIVYFICKGLYQNQRGEIQRNNYVFAKVSHPVIAQKFLSPAPEEIIQQLLQNGKITSFEAEMVRKIPISEDIDVEADSGGHTDNRPLNVLFPTIVSLRNSIVEKYQYQSRIRIGVAGGIGTPEAVAAAFALGAAYIIVGSVHQATIEAGTTKEVKEMLSKAGVADVMMTSSADMFEMGVKVQVLKKGTMMGVRGNQLYDLYKRYGSIEELPEKTLRDLEKNIFRVPIESIWEETKKYFSAVEPEQILLAQKDPKHKMVLIFRWYLGNSSRWPVIGQKDRLMDYQIWCGPAIGSFNEWVRGTFLEAPDQRDIRQVSLNLMEGGAIITRAQQLRTYGLAVGDEAFMYRPKLLKVEE